MPMLKVGETTVEVAQGTRLAVAIEQAGVDIGHRCGGHARCTTCRVTFADGEPTTMTNAEYAKLVERELLGQYRLACQITCDHDMTIAEVPMTKASQNWTDTGPALEAEVTPEAVFLPLDQLT
jgi:ferredoxin